MADTPISLADLLDPLQPDDRVAGQRGSSPEAFLLSTLLSWLIAHPQRLTQLVDTITDGELVRWDDTAKQLVTGEPPQDGAGDPLAYVRQHLQAGTKQWVRGLAAEVASVLDAGVGVRLTANIIPTAGLGGSWVPTVKGGHLHRFSGTDAITINQMAVDDIGGTRLELPAGSNITLVGYEEGASGPRSPDGEQYIDFFNGGSGTQYAMWSHGEP